MRFRYLRDPLFLSCLALYFLNRWLLEPLLPGSFFHNHLNDLICIPFWVPILLWLLRHSGFRADDVPPRWYEVLLPLVLWAWVFEILLPSLSSFRQWAIPDAADIFYYVLGALLASITWRQLYGDRETTPPLTGRVKGVNLE